MNVDRKTTAQRLHLVIALLASMSLCVPPALADSSSISLSSLLADPYQTKPVLLAEGHMLPGDHAGVACATASTAAPPQLSLSKAVDVALCNNAKIRTAWATIKERSAALGLASAALMPTVSMTAGRERTGTSYPGTAIPTNIAKGNTISGSLNWRLFDFGAREADRQAANSLLLAAIHSHDAVVQQTMADTVQAYFDTQSASAVAFAKKQDVAIAEAILASASRRERMGITSHNDTLQAATALARANLDLNRATGDFQKALSVLIYAMGLPPASRTEINPQDMGSDLANGSAGSAEAELDQWLTATERLHPAILAADAQLQAAQSSVTSTRAQGLPTLDLSASYYRNGYPNQGLSTNRERIGNVGLFVSIPLFSGFSHRYQVEQARAVVEERQAELDDTRHSVFMRVVSAHADARSALRNLSASSALLAAANDSLQSSQRRYDKGVADILETLNAQKELATAKEERIRCIAQWEASRLRLLAEAGLLGHSELFEPEGDPSLPAPPQIKTEVR